ncbi:adenosylcobinamide-phosphate synthase CbiB [Desulfatirhabdium butyrativorans]|uniref:adenosylcobinamide-phosphate synthase CbiB n=1 Tax=Desulfatirhabdium butyrativorans TaxID=340467 RepID=UPI000409F994|nr:adenosylcobinamide-phosphate synthase CbiB [Desulfatirhabdium butyrativorans]
MQNVSWLVIPAAFLLDLLLTDPIHFPHPVRWMGKAIERIEPIFRKLPVHLVVSGSLFCLTLVSATWFLGWLSMRWAYAISSLFGWLLECVLLWYCISAGSLAEASGAVVHQLFHHGIESARKAVSMIVGRDTRTLDASGVLRAALETTAENFVDGVLAPLIYYAIGGIPLALAYKMINTLDSMVGYRNPAYLHFGKASARLDDLANWLPARISVLFIAIAAQMLNRQGQNALRTAWQEGAEHLSPNSGLPEAAFAGALHVRLNGPNVYHGILVEKPYIGKAFGGVTPRHVFQSIDLLMLASLLAAGALSIAIWLQHI